MVSFIKNMSQSAKTLSNGADPAIVSQLKKQAYDVLILLKTICNSFSQALQELYKKQSFRYDDI